MNGVTPLSSRRLPRAATGQYNASLARSGNLGGGTLIPPLYCASSPLSAPAAATVRDCGRSDSSDSAYTQKARVVAHGAKLDSIYACYRLGERIERLVSEPKMKSKHPTHVKWVACR